MLQQTQVATVLPYFEKWMARFPSFESLAASEESEVLKHWEGLGYYARARRLRNLAQKWVAEEDKPSGAGAWREFPGVGPYTAALLGTLHFGEKLAAVDGNLVRVLARLTANLECFKDGNHARKAFENLALELLKASENPAAHTEAMMELGALVCLPASPKCGSCPVAAFCQGKEEARLYPSIQRQSIRKLLVHRAFVRREEEILLERAGSGAKRLALLHELPTLESLGQSVPLVSPLLVRSRGIANERITEKIHRVRCQEPLMRHIEEREELNWYSSEIIFGHLALSGPHRKWVREILRSL